MGGAQGATQEGRIDLTHDHLFAQLDGHNRLYLCQRGTATYGLECQVREYAHIKDLTHSKSGQQTLSWDACSAQRGIDSQQRFVELALQYRRSVDARAAIDSMQVCASEKNRILDGLQAAHAEKSH